MRIYARRNKLNANTEDLLTKLIADDKYFDVELAGYWIYGMCCWIGAGLTRKTAIPHLGSAGRGVQEPYNTNIYAWFRDLSERLRYVRVICGDWAQVCGGNWQDNFGNVGIFFDPPYATETRTSVYLHDSVDVAHNVREWAIKRGELATYKIVLCGYFDEHKDLLNHGWTYESWSTSGGYSRIGNGETQGKINRSLETLFFSHRIAIT